MKKLVPVLIAALISSALVACEGDFRRSAQGPFHEVLVVMDSTKWDSETADAIRSTFGGYIHTLPRPEPRFDLRFMDITTQSDLDEAQRHKNVIFAASLDEDTNVGQFIRSSMSEDILDRIREGVNHSFPLGDRWYQNQWAMILSANDDETLAEYIRDQEDELVSGVKEVELERWKDELYGRAEQVDLADSLWNRHGFQIRVQHDYRIGVDTTDFVTLRRTLSDNDRWIWFWWTDEVESLQDIDQQWINTKRDSLMEQYIQGTRDGSYVQTAYNRPMETEPANINGYQGYETRGIWEMTNDFMGGPFINYTLYDEHQQRLYMMEFGQFAPRHEKRRFVYQFEAMARTFETNPDFFRRDEEEVAEND